MISPDKAAEIRRLFFAEHWKQGTIATQLGVHVDVVERVIGPLGPTPKSGPRASSLLDPYKPLIQETLATYPKLTATRLFDMVVARGYPGSVRTVTRYVAKVRPTPKSEVFVRIVRFAGEQAQIDWGHVGRIEVPGGSRPLWVFVMVLAFSRALYAELVYDLTVHSLLRSLVHATAFFGGTTRQWLFDNPKTVVLERQGDLVRYHPDLLGLTAELHVQPRLCAVRKPNQKGGVERAIRYLKDRFFAARTIHSIEQGNMQLARFNEEIAMQRKHPEQDSRTVAQVLEDERAHLLRAPEPLPDVDQIVTVRPDKTATIRFDRNCYSVDPVARDRKTLTLVACDTRVRVLDGTNVVADHPRCWGRKQTIETPEHRQAVLDSKPGARDGQGRRRLVDAVPRFEALLEHWLYEGRNLGSMVARSLKLLDHFGEAVLRQAVDALLDKQSHDLGALTILCDQSQRPKRTRLPLQFGDHVPDRDVAGHDLGDYDDD